MDLDDKINEDATLEVACVVVQELNDASKTMSGASLFHIEHLPGSLTRIMKGETVCWDTEDEHAEDCDGSSESIIQHIVTVLEDEVSADTNLIEVYRDSE